MDGLKTGGTLKSGVLRYTGIRNLCTSFPLFVL